MRLNNNNQLIDGNYCSADGSSQSSIIMSQFGQQQNHDRIESKAAQDADRSPRNGVGGRDSGDTAPDNGGNLLFHCHFKEVEQIENHKARKTLIIASCLCLAFTVAEVVGGYLAGSLAIMTDAAHLLTDFASFLISLFSLFVASRPATRRMSFGWHRAEVLGAFVSVLFIWIITGVLVYMAIERIITKTYEINAKYMLITAAVGVFVNIVMGLLLHQSGHGHSHGSAGKSTNKRTTFSTANNYQQLNSASSASLDSLIDDTVSAENGLVISGNNNIDSGAGVAVVLGGSSKSSSSHGHHKPNINVRAAFIHVLGDFFQSVGVLIAAYVIYYHPELAIMDPICTFVFSVLVLLTTLAIMRDALNVLMEGSPRGIDFLEVADALSNIDGVVRVHNLRIWSLTLDKIALSVHLAIGDSCDSQDILKSATKTLRQRFGVFECTIQIEHYSNDMDECAKCEHPKA